MKLDWLPAFIIGIALGSLLPAATTQPLGYSEPSSWWMSRFRKCELLEKAEKARHP